MIEPCIDPIAEARRYVMNAKDLLTEKGQLDDEAQLYTDRKYVRMAGNTLWNGVLLILNETFHIDKKKGRLSIYDYRIIVGQNDKKLLSLLNRGYDTLHLAMGYDGNMEKTLCITGFQIANDIISHCAVKLTKATGDHSPKTNL